jgi:hypothetical protein
MKVCTAVDTVSEMAHWDAVRVEGFTRADIIKLVLIARSRLAALCK